MDQFFSETKAIAESIEGMLSPFSMAVMDSLLSFQQERGIHGDAIEMGVFRGKSASILGRHMAPTETLRLYDIEDYLDHAGLQRAGAAFDFTIKNTSDISTQSLREHNKAIKFCHIDASHAFHPTVHEMALADYVLASDGILCLDDYTNLNYSQILAATFKYLFTRRTNLTMFLVTAEKAYLCRKRAFPIYAQFVVDRLIPSMLERGIPNTCIAITDATDTYRAFHIREKLSGETDDRYGVSIYGHLYEIDNRSFATKVLHFLARNIRRKKYSKPAKST